MVHSLVEMLTKVSRPLQAVVLKDLPSPFVKEKPVQLFPALQNLISKLRQNALETNKMTLVENSEEANDEVFFIKLELSPGGFIPSYANRVVTERLEVTRGELTLVLNGEAKRLRIGQSAFIAATVQHSYVNAAKQNVVAMLECRPETSWRVADAAQSAPSLQVYL